MGSERGDLGARLQRLEEFFYHFLVYVFHTREGRPMRWWFLRDVAVRTVSYMFATVPFLIILWYYHLFYGQFPALNVAEVVLVIDLAFGAGFLRTVYVYRNRVHFVYDQEAENEPEAVKNLKRENELIEEGQPVKNGDVENEMDAENILGDDFESAAPVRKIDRVILECRKCRTRRAVPASEATSCERCSCGGKMRIL